MFSTSREVPILLKGRALILRRTRPIITYTRPFGITRFIVEVCGPILVILALLAFIVILFRLRFSPVVLAVLAFLVPLGFYVLSLYTGQVGVFVPGAEPASDPRVLFNVRFGCEVAAATGLLLAILAGWMQQVLPRILESKRYCSAAYQCQ